MKLNEQRFLILTALAQEPLHGYGLAEEIADLTDGRHKPRAGALYHGLDKMLEQGLVEIDREEIVGGRLRRYYQLTESGKETLTEEALHRQQTSAQAIRRLGMARGITALFAPPVAPHQAEPNLGRLS